MTSEEVALSYLAGLFDGNGSVTLGPPRNGSFRNPCISISSKERVLCEFAQRMCGGHLALKKATKPEHSDSWEWRRVDDAALVMLGDILPFMRHPVKRAKARMLVERYKSVTVRNGRYSDQERAAKVAFEEEFAALT